MKISWLVLGIMVSSSACKSGGSRQDDSATAASGQQSNEEDIFNFLSMTPEEINKKYSDPTVLFKARGRNHALRTGKACSKLDTLWDAIWSTKQEEDEIVPAGRDNVLAFGNGTAEAYWKAFTGFEGGSEVRPEGHLRLTHRYGTFAQLRLVIDEAQRSKYSGHFQGNECILGRFSSAVSPGSAKDRFTPAFSAKFFMDGNFESQVLIAQHDIGGQGLDMNYFAKPLSNRLLFEKEVWAGLGAFSRFYWTAQKFLKVNGINIPDPRELSAEHLGTMTPGGKKVDAPAAPRFVYLLPADVSGFPSEWHDYREDFLGLNQKVALDPASQKGKVLKGIKIFHLYVSDTFTTDPLKEATKIGSFETKSVFVASDTADRRVFFKHSIVPRETVDYPSDFPMSNWNDEWFSASCDRLSATQADLADNALIPGDTQGHFVESYVFKRRCAREFLETRLGGM